MSGLMRVVVRIIAHAIALEGIGPQCLSPVFYHYLALDATADTEQLHPFLTTDGQDAEVEHVLNKVS